MSLPARELPVPRSHPSPRRTAPPARTPAARPRPSTPPQASRRTRRGHRPAFWWFTAGVLSFLLLGLVALNALLVQTTYRMQDVQQQVRDLADHQVRLSNDAAMLSSPQRVHDWAASQGMTMPGPGDTVILRVPGVAAALSGDAG
jgi:cell division protein FtsL